MKVYIVGSMEYEGLDIQKIFKTRESAEKWLKSGDRDRQIIYEIYEYEVED